MPLRDLCLGYGGMPMLGVWGYDSLSISQFQKWLLDKIAWLQDFGSTPAATPRLVAVVAAMSSDCCRGAEIASKAAELAELPALPNR